MGGFGVVLKLGLGVVGALVILLVYPSVKIYIDSAVAEWVWADATLLAVIDFFPIIALVVIGIATMWWVLSGE